MLTRRHIHNNLKILIEDEENDIKLRPFDGSESMHYKKWFDDPEITKYLLPNTPWNQRIGTNAIRILVNAIRDEFNHLTASAVRNPASVKLLSNLGFTLIGDNTKVGGLDFILDLKVHNKKRLT